MPPVDKGRWRIGVSIYVDGYGAICFPEEFYFFLFERLISLLLNNNHLTAVPYSSDNCQTNKKQLSNDKMTIVERLNVSKANITSYDSPHKYR